MTLTFSSHHASWDMSFVDSSLGNINTTPFVYQPEINSLFTLALIVTATSAIIHS